MFRSKKLIGIVTINDLTNNYGNRLQNFALHKILSSYGKSVNILFPHSSLLKLEISRLIQPARLFLKKQSSRTQDLKICRDLEFCLFTRRYLPESYLSKYKKSLSTFKTIILGSDQVWNYRWISKSELALRLGSFVPVGLPVCSYAASIGVSEIANEAKAVFRDYLPRLKSISVREDRAAELIHDLTGLKATVVLDPTLMLPAREWRRITRGFVPDGDRYVLTYFLGKPTDSQERRIQAYARTLGCRVRRMLDLRDPETYVAGPQDFVELFSKAQYVFTDSYHACCFSLLFHKQFTVFNRAGTNGKASMNSRMDTLFRLFGVDSLILDEGLAPEIDYAKVDSLLEQHRQESKNWLDNAMEA